VLKHYGGGVERGKKIWRRKERGGRGGEKGNRTHGKETMLHAWHERSNQSQQKNWQGLVRRDKWGALRKTSECRGKETRREKGGAKKIVKNRKVAEIGAKTRRRS